MKLINILVAIRAEALNYEAKIFEKRLITKRAGICWSICQYVRLCEPDPEKRYILTPRLRAEFEVLAKRWPKYSGTPGYPIVRSDLAENEDGGMESYELAQSKGTMWEGEYGQLRLELLDFCIEQLEREL